MSTHEKLEEFGLVLVDKGSHTQLRSKRELKGKKQDQSFSMVLMSLDAHSQIESLPNIINQARKEAAEEGYKKGYIDAGIEALKEGK